MSKRSKPLSLTCEQSHLLIPTPPFLFEGTLHKPSHFPVKVDAYIDGRHHFVMRQDSGGYVGVVLMQESEAVRVVFHSIRELEKNEIDYLLAEINWRFGLFIDIRHFMEMVQDDPILQSIDKKWCGMRPSCSFSLYELLCITTVLQNAQVSRSVSMLGRMLEKYGQLVRFSGVDLYAFWDHDSLAKVEEKELRALKVGYRAKTFLRTSMFFMDNPDFEYSIRGVGKSDAKRCLKKVYGVGPASAGYLLFESLKHLDAFDYVSPWETKILSHLFLGHANAASDEIVSMSKERWGEWRMLAVHNIFEDLFWRHRREKIDWLEALIRL